METLLNDAYEPDHGVYHMFHTSTGARLPGMLDDQVYTARALLDAFSVTGSSRYLETARQLMDLCISHYWDEEHGGFTDLARERLAAVPIPLLRQPRKTIEDMPAPAANALAVVVLDRLWLLTRDDRYSRYAQETLRTFAGTAVEQGLFSATYGLAVRAHLSPPAEVVIIGMPDSEDTRRLRAAALRAYRPGLLVACFSPEDSHLPYPASGQSAVAYVCVNRQCLPPLSDADELTQVIMTAGR